MRAGRRSACLVAFVTTTTLLAVAACASIPRGRDGVDDLDFEGVEQIDEDVLRERIATRERSTFLGIAWPWTEWPLYDRAILRRDLERIVRFYRARGYYDAQVGTPRVDREGRGEETGSVDIAIPIEEGRAVRIGHVELSFLAPADGEAPVPEVLRRRLRHAVPLQPGAIFDEQEYEAAKTSLLEALHELSYAAAEIQGHVRVDPTRHRAHVTLRVRAGPVHRFGGVHLYGHAPLPARRVLSLVEIERGSLYRASTLHELRNDLYDLGVFATVRVTPQVHAAERSVDVRIDVTPGRLQRLRLGVGAALEPSRGDIHLVATYEHRNFFGGLRRLRGEVQPRLVFDLDDATQELSVTPGVLASVAWRTPGVLERRIWLTADARYDVGPHPSARDIVRHLFNVSLGLERRFGQNVTGAASLNYELYLPISTGTNADAIDSAITDPWAFPYLQETLRFDTRDDPLRPTRGVLLSTNLQQAGLVPSTWDYLRVAFDMRAYVRPWSSMVLAVRGGMGLLRTFSGPEGGPLSKRFFVGGANSVRGYGYGRAGSRLVDCRVSADSPDTTSCTQQNLGGTTSWEAGLELRQRIVGDLGFVAFADAGDADIAGDLRFDFLHLTVGLGLRYYTIIGPIRFDVGWRVPGAQRLGAPLPNAEREPDLDVLVGQIPIAFHLALGEAF